MVYYEEIKKQIDDDFDVYLSTLLKINYFPRKYFYWSFDFFRIVGGLSFEYFTLSDEQKGGINKIGESYFQSTDVLFKVNENSHRHDLLIKPIEKIFENPVSNQKKRYEYIKEFIFWDVLKKYKEKLSKEFDELKGDFSDSAKELSDKKKDELNYINDVVKKQRDNYLITYVNYLINNIDNPSFIPFANYKKYSQTKKGEELIKKLDELDRDYIYDSKTGKETKQTIHKFNPVLRRKIENLYILIEEEPRLHFVFTKNQGGGKEELRELLDIMGSDKTVNLYRGQADASWELDASVTREPKYRANEGDLYYDILSLKPDAFQNDKTVYERLITMQHFGMPTRLMDITRNPLVAIFFACNNLERKDSDGVIFTFKPENKTDFLNFEDKRLKSLAYLFSDEEINWEEEETTEEKVKEFLSKIWFIRGVAKNQRINNQSGDFIFVGNGDDVKDKLYQLPKMTIVIDSKTKEVLIEQLESLNIHGGAVYPDLTHMSTYIKHKYLKDGALTQESKKPEPTKRIRTKPPKKGTKTTETPTSLDMVKSFDFETIKNKDRNTQLDEFSKFYNLEKIKLEKIVDDINFTEKPPLNDEVTNAMNEKPPLKIRVKILKSLVENIITLSKLISESEE